ncbi:MAG: nitroreductase family protein [Clostridiales bacterium]|nr:nitroreductase family protein [Clostridiales bacterium]
MNVLETIGKRRSYRGRYKPVKVPREDLIRILQAGLDAPSGCNKQTTSLIAVDDEETMEKILSVIDPPVAKGAPAAICVLTRRINAYRDKCYSIQDYSAAIENMLLAMVELGYQSCWYEGHITDTDRICDRIAEILDVPDSYELVCFLPVGVAADEPVLPKKRPFEERACFNTFRNMAPPKG